MEIDSILSRLRKVRKSGQGWTACCPAHDDKNASLSVKVTETGRLLAYCHAGCSFEAILESLGLGRERFTPSPRPIETGPSKEQLEAQGKAVRLWTNARPANKDHTYLIRKNILPHHARQIGDSLVIPLQDSGGNIWNLQFIHPDGTKRFLRAGATKGLFTVIGDPTETGRLYLGEGWATCCTIHELTGSPVVVAFSAHNLPPGAMIIRRAFPQAEIVWAADDDPAGVQVSEQAARAVHGLVAYAGRAS